MNERFDRDSAQKALAAADNLRQLLAAFKQQMRDSKFVEEANEVPDKEETSKAKPDVPGQLGGQDSAPEPASQETVPEAGEVEEDYSKTLVAPFALK